MLSHSLARVSTGNPCLALYVPTQYEDNFQNYYHSGKKSFMRKSNVIKEIK